MIKVEYVKNCFTMTKMFSKEAVDEAEIFAHNKWDEGCFVTIYYNV